MLNSTEEDGLRMCVQNINDLMVSEKRSEAEPMIRPFIGQDLSGGINSLKKKADIFCFIQMDR